MNLETIYYQIIAEDRKPLLHPLFWILRGLAGCYEVILKVRAGFYRRKIFRSYHLDKPVISVGNLTLGGTGKTPMVIKTAEAVMGLGWKPAILSRGYGGVSKKQVNVVCDGERVLLSAQEAGDEPVMIARRLQSVPVVTGRDRVATGRYAIESLKADCLILDDGFQRLSLHRDLNLLLLDCKHPIGNAQLFPAGTLREPMESASRADVLVWTRCVGPESPDKSFLAEKEFVEIKTELSFKDFVSLKDGKGQEASGLEGQGVFAFCGIAQPESFLSLIKQKGAKIFGFYCFPDHHNYSAKEISIIQEEAKSAGASVLVTTEKDAVKLDPEEINLPVWTVRVEMNFLDGEECFDSILRETLESGGQRISQGRDIS